MITVLLLLILFSYLLDRLELSRWLADWKKYGSAHYRDDGKREVITSGYNWVVMRQESGDVDILPVGEEMDHGRRGVCSCKPRVDLEGAYLVTVHNSFDHREIIEEAINVMNGVE